MNAWMRFIVVVVVALAVGAPPLPALAGYSSGKSSVSRSSSSSSGGSRSSSSSSSSRSGSSSSSSSGYSSGKGTSYSSGKGGSYSSGKGYSSTPSASPGTGSFGASAAAAQRRTESATNRPAYSAPRIATPHDQQVAYLRGQLDAQRYADRQSRQQSFYVGYYGRPYGSTYSDGYSPWFWLWLLDRPQYQATWCYHHRYAMDQARYNSLLNENAELRSQVEQLEAQNTPRNPNYVPPDLPEADLMYTDAYVAAATQPAEAPTAGGGDFDPQTSPTVSVATEGYGSPGVGTHVTEAHSSGTTWSSMGSGFVCVGTLVAGVMGLVWVTNRKSASAATAGYAMPPRQPPPPPPPLPRQAFVPPPATPPGGPYNPLRLGIGASFTLDAPELGGRFTVGDLLQYTALVAGQPFTFVSYKAQRVGGGDPQAIELRVERISDQEFAVVALRLHDELDYSQEFYAIVATDGTGRFQVTDDATGQVTAEYFRPAGVLAAYNASVTAASGQTMQRIQYWDYSRKLAFPDRRGVNEYLIVEMDEARHFRILIGPQVDARAVQVQ